MEIVELIYLYIMIIGTVVLMVILSFLGPETRKLMVKVSGDFHRVSMLTRRITRPMLHITWLTMLSKFLHFVK